MFEITSEKYGRKEIIDRIMERAESGVDRIPVKAWLKTNDELLQQFGFGLETSGVDPALASIMNFRDKIEFVIFNLHHLRKTIKNQEVSGILYGLISILNTWGPYDFQCFVTDLCEGSKDDITTIQAPDGMCWIETFDPEKGERVWSNLGICDGAIAE